MTPYPQANRAAPAAIPVSPGKDRLKRPYQLRRDRQVIPFRSSRQAFVELSNFHDCTFKTPNGDSYRSTEHGYQSRMADLAGDQLNANRLSDHHSHAKMVKSQASAMKKKWSPEFTSQVAHLRPYVMKQLLLVKFGKRECADVLAATRDAQIVEASPGDSYWGCGVNAEAVTRGRFPPTFTNVMGTLLEEVREERIKGNTKGPELLIAGGENLAWMRKYNEKMPTVGILTLPGGKDTLDAPKKLLQFCATPSVKGVGIQLSKALLRKRKGTRYVRRSYTDVLKRASHMVQKFQETVVPNTKVHLLPYEQEGPMEKDAEYMEGLHKFFCTAKLENGEQPFPYLQWATKQYWGEPEAHQNQQQQQ